MCHVLWQVLMLKHFIHKSFKPILHTNTSTLTDVCAFSELLFYALMRINVFLVVDVGLFMFVHGTHK